MYNFIEINNMFYKITSKNINKNALTQIKLLFFVSLLLLF